MKFLIWAMLFFNTLIFAKVEETQTSYYSDYRGIEAQKFFNLFQFPIDFGTLVTGKKHQYKAYSDTAKNFLIYCAEESKNNFYCRFEISKNLSGEDVIIESNDLLAHLILTNYKTTKKLYELMNVEPILHGNYALKVITDEDNMVGVSCMTDTNSYAEYRCDINLFK